MKPIINDKNSFTVKGVKFLIVKTSLENGIWYHSIKNLSTNKRNDNIPDHKIKKYF